MNGVYGGTIPALIWKETMKVATQKFGSTDFDYPPIELKRSAKTESKIITEENSSEEPPKPEAPLESTNLNETPANTQVTNPVSFNNTFLEPNNQKNVQPAPPVNPPTPPIPGRP